MSNAANQLPIKFSPQEQLATLLGIQACLNSGMKLTSIASKLAGSCNDDRERFRWENVKAAVEADESFGVAVINSGLFSASVERIFAVVDDADKAVATSIEFVKAVIAR